MARRGAQARAVAERNFTEPQMRAAYERLYQSLPTQATPLLEHYPSSSSYSYSSPSSSSVR